MPRTLCKYRNSAHFVHATRLANSTSPPRSGRCYYIYGHWLNTRCIRPQTHTHTILQRTDSTYKPLTRIDNKRRCHHRESAYTNQHIIASLYCNHLIDSIMRRRTRQRTTVITTHNRSASWSTSLSCGIKSNNISLRDKPPTTLDRKCMCVYQAIY